MTSKFAIVCKKCGGDGETKREWVEAANSTYERIECDKCGEVEYL